MLFSGSNHDKTLYNGLQNRAIVLDSRFASATCNDFTKLIIWLGIRYRYSGDILTLQKIYFRSDSEVSQYEIVLGCRFPDRASPVKGNIAPILLLSNLPSIDRFEWESLFYGFFNRFVRKVISFAK